jgi:hypothetical protein
VTALFDLVTFYSVDAWTKDADGNVHPSQLLLEDQGKRALAYHHPSHGKVWEEKAIQANYHLAMAELADAVRDLALAMNMPPGESRNFKIGGLCVKLQNIDYSLRRGPGK